MTEERVETRIVSTPRRDNLPQLRIHFTKKPNFKIPSVLRPELVFFQVKGDRGSFTPIFDAAAVCDALRAGQYSVGTVHSSGPAAGSWEDSSDLSQVGGIALFSAPPRDTAALQAALPETGRDRASAGSHSVHSGSSDRDKGQESSDSKKNSAANLARHPPKLQHFGSVNAGDAGLYVGGTAINQAFATQLKAAGQDVDKYWFRTSKRDLSMPVPSSRIQKIRVKLHLEEAEETEEETDVCLYAFYIRETESGKLNPRFVITESA